MGRHRTPEEKVALGEQARAMRATGHSRREIAAALHVGDDLVKALPRGTELPDSLRRPRAKDEHRAAAAVLRRAGQTYDEIAAELGVSKSSLPLWLRDLVPPTQEQRSAVPEPQPVPPPGQLSLLDPDLRADRIQLARQMRLSGCLLREIADEFAVSVKTVCLWCTGSPSPKRVGRGGDREHVRRMSRKRWDATLAEREAERLVVKATAAQTVGILTDRELELVAVTAYWCEGSKDKAYDRRESLKRHNPKTVRKNVGDAYVGCLVVRVLQDRVLYQEIEGIWRGICVGTFPSAGRVAS